MPRSLSRSARALLLGGALWLALAPAGRAAAQARGGGQTQRGIPRALREALTGCWLVDGIPYEVVPQGETGLRSRWRARPARGGPSERHHGPLLYHPASGQVIGGCGGRTQHGQSCRFSVEGGRPQATMVSRYSGRGHAISMERCPAGTPEVGDPPPPSRRPTDRSRPAELFGYRLRAIEAWRSGERLEDGWVRYAPSERRPEGAVEVRYDFGVVARVRVRLDPALTCAEAAAAFGFPDARPARESAAAEGAQEAQRRCVWSDRGPHRLARERAGSFEGGLFEAWRVYPPIR